MHETDISNQVSDYKFTSLLSWVEIHYSHGEAGLFIPKKKVHICAKKKPWWPELSEENLIDSMALFIRLLE